MFDIDSTAEPQCMYCLESDPVIELVPSLLPFSSASALVHLGCDCKGSTGRVHIACKAKFARYKTHAAESTPRTREYYWTNCEICHGPMTNGDAVLQLARERHWQCLYHRRDDDSRYGEDGAVVSREAFWKELCMSACFFATVIVKRCKDATVISNNNAVGLAQSSSLGDNANKGPFWIESCNMLSSTIQLLQQLTPSPRQLALLWSAEMKFVDCLYYAFQMMMDRNTSLAENELVYNEAVQLVNRYNLRFSSLAISMFQMKKFAQDVSKSTGGKRDADGSLLLTSQESEEFQQLKKKIVKEMKLANSLGGDERHYFSRELSYQVEFVNYEIYRSSEEKRTDK